MRTRTWRFVISLVASFTFAGAATRAADPTTADCLGASDASLKLGNQHKLRAERSQLLVCAAATCPADIRKECQSRVEEVNVQLPTVVFSAKDSSGADLSAVRVTMDGEVLAERLQGTALSIDPGEHAFTFETAGQAPFTKKLVVVEGQKDRRELVTFGTPPEATGTALPAGTSPIEESGGLGTQKVLALVAGGVGVVGLGLGATFGAIAMSKKSQAQTACPGQCATQDGVSDWSSAASAGNLSTIAFIVGGVGIAGAAVLWFTAPGATRQTGAAQVGVGPGGLLVRGVW